MRRDGERDQGDSEEARASELVSPVCLNLELTVRNWQKVERCRL